MDGLSESTRQALIHVAVAKAKMDQLGVEELRDLAKYFNPGDDCNERLFANCLIEEGYDFDTDLYQTDCAQDYRCTMRWDDLSTDAQQALEVKYESTEKDL